MSRKLQEVLGAAFLELGHAQRAYIDASSVAYNESARVACDLIEQITKGVLRVDPHDLLADAEMCRDAGKRAAAAEQRMTKAWRDLVTCVEGKRGGT